MGFIIHCSILIAFVSETISFETEPTTFIFEGDQYNHSVIQTILHQTFLNGFCTRTVKTLPRFTHCDDLLESRP